MTASPNGPLNRSLNGPLNWKDITAVFGGTFDPPHLGHRQAIQGLFENPGIRRVLVMPSGTPPLKPQATSTEHRFQMASLAFNGLSDVKVDDRELKQSLLAGYKPSYTIETLLELKREIPDLAFVLGADQLAQLHTWHRFQEILAVSHWIVLARQPNGEKVATKTLNEWELSSRIRRGRDSAEWLTSSGTRIRLVSTQAQAVSSSEVREEIGRETQSEALLGYLNTRLSPIVLSYLMEHRIYGIHRPPVQTFDPK
jgi:nicotinate-nucleotide adenylyltransferase